MNSKFPLTSALSYNFAGYNDSKLYISGSITHLILNTRHLKVQELAKIIGAEIIGAGQLSAADITHDSRMVTRDSIFVAIKGSTVDGNRFIADALRRGAIGIISESNPTIDTGDISSISGNTKAPLSANDYLFAWLKVKNAREAHAKAAAAIFSEPSRDLDLIGITGTNGKTTTTYLCFALAEAAGAKPAMLTTVEYRIGDRSEPAVRTTPEASDTNRFLRQAVDEGCKMAAMEASSQALDLRRCDCLFFRVAIFTNLTQDHLDYHGTMENYFDAKKRLFDGRLGEPPPAAVINIDDPWGRRLSEEIRGTVKRVITIGIENQADFTAKDILVSLLSGTSFEMQAPFGNIHINSPLVGRPHVYNMLAASAAAFECGLTAETIISGLEKCIGAPGRFERVREPAPFAVIVDYAHTDDALLNTLKTARELATGRVITVFGCGGDRDRAKRPLMGRVAAQNSDMVIITSDNPRTEDPLKIISEIEAGMAESNVEKRVISDRREAIKTAISLARENDVVIIAGKGHETYQIIGNEKFHFDDREVAAEFIRLLGE